ncbi:hypothetical protein AFL01nite_10190 [Aeromicrobium flavum]|uniref:Glycosyltransferase GT-D fold domain-containing protein n=1 Tax=Aeromicrobium flavum TaxID=416568 RepID=A0A512HTA9_9ACTN|nr:GT-D fold domain-containing glycosyltransferase [Aeromicrobium flavum]GEO88692.1 hypothetical protein AFL01nite_10190 [Aeromicrobium flavum]
MGMREMWLRHRGARQRSLEDVVGLLQDQNALLSDIRSELRQQRREITGKDRRRLEGIITQSLAEPVRAEVRRFHAERTLGMRETVERLVREPVGFSRFGDGEFWLMLRITFSLRFQKNSFALQDALRDAFTRPTDDLMIGFPHPFHTLHWTNVWTDLWNEVSDLAPSGVRFGDSHVTRPIFFEEFGSEGVDLWRRVWEDRTVTVVAGESGRFSLVDELFSSARELDVVWSVPTDGFADLDRVVAELQSRPRTDLYLLSLGPAATVLARRLADLGLRAIDIGHISDSYLTTFEGGLLPEKRPIVRPE